MALILKAGFRTYQKYFHELDDAHTRDYVLLRSPLYIALILGSFYYFVKHLGPKWMEDRPPYDLKRFMIVYNVVQVLANAWVGSWCYYYSYHRDWYSYKCQPVAEHGSELGKLEVYYTHAYFLLKLLDLTDTIIFVLRKQFHKVSWLHFYHHLIMAAASWVGAKFLPGGHSTLLGILNTFVHVVMYTYYLLTTLSDEAKQSLWWKKHLTQLQILQFLILMFHYGRAFIFHTCAYPRFWLAVGFLQAIFFFLLFFDFYRKAYEPKKSPKTE